MTKYIITFQKHTSSACAVFVTAKYIITFQKHSHIKRYILLCIGMMLNIQVQPVNTTAKPRPKPLVVGWTSPAQVIDLLYMFHNKVFWTAA